MATRDSQLPPVPSFAATMSNMNVGLKASEEMLNERKQILYEFLDSQRSSTDSLEYRDKIRGMLRRGDSRLIVNMNDVRHFNVDYARGLLFEPMEYLAAFDESLKDMVYTIGLGDTTVQTTDPTKIFYHVGIEGSFGEMQVSPRTLCTRYLGKMISIEGIVTTCLMVRPKLVKSVHYVEKKSIFVMREYRDATMSANYVPTLGSNAYPTEDQDGNSLSTEYGYCHYRDHQKVILQEMPERAPAGQLPRSLEVLLVDDLVDSIKPGDRVTVVGVYKALATVGSGGQVPPHFRTVLLANRVRHLGKETQLPMLTDVDIQNIKKIAKRADLYELMGRSIAPSICGHSFIKKAILLMLLGGVEKNLENTHLRGDINLLMVGDPSTAKSQLLRFVLHVAPLAIATTGRGSSGVGLTAAVLMDKETGERRLEAGAMVLADRGIVCIDEFDKMSEMDRVAIHEVMEQQTVTIAKAGIHLSLNARCSVVAAANPIYSQYRDSLTPQENIRLPDSLLSRFDLLFIVLDNMNERTDRVISQHVTAMHRYLAPGQEEGTLSTNADPLEHLTTADDTMETPIFEKTNRHLYHHLLNDLEDDDEEDEGLTAEELALIQAEKQECLSIGFLKKYLHYAKVRMKPILTLEASESIRRAYHDFRSRKELEHIRTLSSGGTSTSMVSVERTLPVTPRTLETLIRLATAHAKLRLSVQVQEEDVQVAEEILRFCLYKEVIKKKKKSSAKKQRKNDSPDDPPDGDLKKLHIGDRATEESDHEEEYLSDDEDGQDETDVFDFPKDDTGMPSLTPKTRRGAKAIFEEDDEQAEDEDSTPPEATSMQTDESAGPTTVSAEQARWIHAALNRVRASTLATTGGDFIPLARVVKDLEENHASPPSIDQVEIVLNLLADDGKLYISSEGHIIFL